MRVVPHNPRLLNKSLRTLSNNMQVSLDTIFGEILEEYPRSEDVLKKYLGEAYCLSCPGKMFDTIGNGALIHGLSDETAKAMVADLQACVDEQDQENQ